MKNWPLISDILYCVTEQNNRVKNKSQKLPLTYNSLYLLVMFINFLHIYE